VGGYLWGGGGGACLSFGFLGFFFFGLFLEFLLLRGLGLLFIYLFIMAPSLPPLLCEIPHVFIILTFTF
jgi:hypothetical protein